MSQTLTQTAVSAVFPLRDESSDTVPEMTIDAQQSPRQYWRDLWAFRELIFFMSWRDVLVRYKQTAIGVAWSVLRPLLTMAVGTFIFDRVLHLPGLPGVPYAIMIYAALLPWQFFSDALSQSALSLTSNANLISKIYFPRLILPISKAAVSLVDFGISLLIMALLMAWYGFAPSWHIIFLPAFVLLAFLAVMALGQWFAALNVRYRDFMYIVPFVVQFGIYITPVFFTSERIFESNLPEWAKLLYALNPLVTVVEGFRWCLLGDVVHIYVPGVVAAGAIVAVLLVTGNWYFRRTEATFADYI